MVQNVMVNNKKYCRLVSALKIILSHLVKSNEILLTSVFCEAILLLRSSRFVEADAWPLRGFTSSYLFCFTVHNP